MRRIALVLAFCFAISPLSAAVTKTVKPKTHKVKAKNQHKAPKVKKHVVAKH